METFLNEADKEMKEQNKKSGKEYKGFSDKVKERIQKKARTSLRCTILRRLLMLSYRALSCRIGESYLLQKFCVIDNIDQVKVPSKSKLERFEKYYDEEFIREIIRKLIKTASGSENILQLEKQIDVNEIFIDLTCIKADIHFPVDWVLLRDATRTLMKAVKLIRKYGLKNRMDNPLEFIKKINKLSMQMSLVKYKKGAKKKRKYILRLMKKMLKKIALHAVKHKELLLEKCESVKLSYKQIKQIVKRIDNILNQLPFAIKQAHERIIGERKVADYEKILSLYEQNIHVIVRGKAGARVEFGNTLSLCEQKDGLIIDWKLYKEKAPHDSKTIVPSIKRIQKGYDNRINSVTGDRGCWAKDNLEYLKENNIKNYICPRSVKEMQERLEDEEFCIFQARRAQTEGRIGIFKNCFIGKPLRSEGFENRERSIALGVLAHNLWLLARLKIGIKDKKQKVA